MASRLDSILALAAGMNAALEQKAAKDDVMLSMIQDMRKQMAAGAGATDEQLAQLEALLQSARTAQIHDDARSDEILNVLSTPLPTPPVIASVASPASPAPDVAATPVPGASVAPATSPPPSPDDPPAAAAPAPVPASAPPTAPAAAQATESAPPATME